MTENKPSRVCVTGAAGYIGSLLVKRLLEKGHSVHATLRNLGLCLFDSSFQLCPFAFIDNPLISCVSNMMLQGMNQKWAFWSPFLTQIATWYFFKLISTIPLNFRLPFTVVNLFFTWLPHCYITLVTPLRFCFNSTECIYIIFPFWNKDKG